MIGRLALRNLSRNRWRTTLTVAGVAVAVAMLVWTMAYMEGFVAEMVKQSTQVSLGQVNIQSEEFADRAAVRFAFDVDDPFLKTIESEPGVVATAPRVIAFGLVGHEKKSIVARIVGIDPDREAATTIADDNVIEGRWLTPNPPDYPAPREVVVGSNFAKQLEVSVNDEVVMFFEAADGALGNDLLKIVGIVETRNSQIDRQTVFIGLKDLQFAAGLEGKVNEIAVRIENVAEAEPTALHLQKAIRQEDLVVRPWQKLVPELADMVKLMDQTDIVMFGLVYLIVAFGLFNAQRMSALERSREFGVIRAIGVTPYQLFFSVVLESVLVTLVGGIAGVIFGGLFSYYFVVNGLDLTAWTGGESVGMMGVDMNSLTFVINAKVLLKPLAYIVPVALLCGIWPAWKAARLDITSAISGRT